MYMVSTSQLEDWLLQNGLWWLLGDKASASASLRVLRFVALVGTLVGLEGRVLLPTFGHYLGLHYPWNIVAISAALMGAGSLMLLHFEGQFRTNNYCLLSKNIFSVFSGYFLHTVPVLSASSNMGVVFAQHAMIQQYAS